MKFHSPMIIVSDISRSKEFYINVLHEEITQDLESYVVFGGGFSMMTNEQWHTLTKKEPRPNNHDGHHFELYFEEDNIEDFVQQLSENNDITYFTPLEETPWGQRAVRILDPDNYVIEVAETMEAVVTRLLSSGLTIQETAKKSLMPIDFVQKCYHERKE